METLDLTPAGARTVIATKKHARELARCIHPKIQDEVKASCGFPPEPAIRASMNRSIESYAVYAGVDLIAIFGVTKLKIRDGWIYVPWAMSSVHAAKHPVAFWKASRITVNYLRSKYPVMMNMAHSKYPQAIRWLERLGFTMSPPEKYGVRGDLFCRATMVTQKVVMADAEASQSAALREVLGV